MANVPIKELRRRDRSSASSVDPRARLVTRAPPRPRTNSTRRRNRPTGPAIRRASPGLTDPNSSRDDENAQSGRLSMARCPPLTLTGAIFLTTWLLDRWWSGRRPASRSEPGSARPRRVCASPPDAPTEALPGGRRKNRSKQDPADNTGDDEREERGHAAVLQKAD